MKVKLIKDCLGEGRGSEVRVYMDYSKISFLIFKRQLKTYLKKCFSRTYS